MSYPEGNRRNDVQIYLFTKGFDKSLQEFHAVKQKARTHIGATGAGICNNETRTLDEAAGKEIAKKELSCSVEIWGE